MMNTTAFTLLLATAVLGSSGGLLETSHSQVGTFGRVDNVTRCGGFGTPMELRVSDCEGYCKLTPGRLYQLEVDFYPSSPAVGLSLAIDLVANGTPYRLFEVEIPGSSVQPGFLYTLKYSIVPNDIMAGQTVKLRGIIFNTVDRVLEVCYEVDVDILEL